MHMVFPHSLVKDGFDMAPNYYVRNGNPVSFHELVRRRRHITNQNFLLEVGDIITNGVDPMPDLLCGAGA